MKIIPFTLERYFASHEFSARYLLSSSDCDGLSMTDILDHASPAEHQQWKNLTLGYTESAGLPELREEIATLYSTLSAQHILVMSPGEVNFILMNVLLQQSDHVICMAPAYQSLYQVALSIGCELSFWKPREQDNQWYFDPDDLLPLFKPSTKLLIINFPHNPTGFLPSQNDFERIISLARQHHVYVFSDEMYRMLQRTTADLLPNVCDVYEKGISLWGMAKTFALAGLRVGWVATRDERILYEMAGYKDYLTICNSAPSELLALMGLRQRERIVAINASKIASNINQFKSFCERYPDTFTFSPPKAGSTAFARMTIGEATLDFCNRLVREAGIMLLPSEMFDFDQHHVRIGFGRNNFSDSLEQLDRYLRK